MKTYRYDIVYILYYFEHFILKNNTFNVIYTCIFIYIYIYYVPMFFRLFKKRILKLYVHVL